MIEEAAKLPALHTVESDVCVIGAGPAGITLSLELARGGLRVALLESGGIEPSPRTQELNHGSVIGETYAALDTARLRCLGGTSQHWTGWCRPLAPSDFEARPWIEWSGWPFSHESMAPDYERAQELCGLGAFDYRPARWAKEVGAPLLALHSPLVETVIWQFSAPVRFGTRYRSEIERSERLETYLHATALELEAPGGREVSRVRVARADGEHFFVRAKRYVLAAGALENARLLLTSDSEVRGGIGNAHDLVGRFFAEHPHTVVGKVLSPLDDRALKLYQWVKDVAGGSPAAVRAGLALTADAQRREGLLACSMTLDPAVEAPPGAAAAEMGRLVEELYGRRARAFDLLVRAEQAPNPESRVRLGAERDRLGMRRVELDWRIGEVTRRSIRRAVEIVAAAVGRSGIGRVYSYAHAPELSPGAHWPAIGGGFHHMGTTRMHHDPRRGVVDATCRVHGVANLYVAGSSVFPTTGLANPTLTLVALALRLSDHLLGGG